MGQLVRVWKSSARKLYNRTRRGVGNFCHGQTWVVNMIKKQGGWHWHEFCSVITGTTALQCRRGGLMKLRYRLLIAVAVLGLIATIGTANAAVITSATVTIWNAATPDATSTSISQQGLPTAVGLFGGPLPLVAGSAPFTFPINYNDTGADTIPGFFASDTPPAPTPTTCTSAACLTSPDHS